MTAIPFAGFAIASFLCALGLLAGHVRASRSGRRDALTTSAPTPARLAAVARAREAYATLRPSRRAYVDALRREGASCPVCGRPVVLSRDDLGGHAVLLYCPARDCPTTSISVRVVEPLEPGPFLPTAADEIAALEAGDSGERVVFRASEAL